MKNHKECTQRDINIENFFINFVSPIAVLFFIGLIALGFYCWEEASEQRSTSVIIVGWVLSFLGLWVFFTIGEEGKQKGVWLPRQDIRDFRKDLRL